MRAILTSVHKCVVVTTAFCVACFETHSADDSDLDQRSVVSESFDPHSGRLKEDDSAADQLWWRYRINQGKPLTIDLSGDDSITMEFDDQLMIVNRSNRTRLTTEEMRFRSSADGISETMTVEQTENLEFGQTTRILSQRLITKQESEQDGKTVSSISDMIVEVDPPMECVLDRSDLDKSEPGEEILQQTYDMHYSGSEETTIEGQKQTNPLDERVVKVTVIWTVIEKYKSLSVQGTNYRNVIEIECERTAFLNEYSEGVVTVSTGWVAKGIGVIKTNSRTPFSDLTDDYAIELVDTNLVQ